jgi:hypothetical protein
MAETVFITVTAPAGRMTPIHERDGREPNGSQLRVEHGTVCRVRASQTVMRSVMRGDLLLCRVDGTLVTALADAIAPESMETHKINLSKPAAAPKNGGKS